LLLDQVVRIENIRKVFELAHLPKFPYDRTLKCLMSPPVFGREMLKALAESNIVLNVHADSSPLYASNMRLFETTGAGSVLLTEKRKNLSELFDPDKEVAAYGSAEECIEKARWLQNHPEECIKISAEGRKRTLRDHTFDVRAEQVNDILKNHFK
jgi:spore maturation protein CgeB